MFEGLVICVGVELKILEGNLFSCRTCLLSKKGNALTITGTKKIEGSLVEVLEEMPKKLPVALVLTGKGVLHKQIQIPLHTTPEVKFNTAYSGVDAKEFYSQQYTESENTLVSIARMQLIDDLLSKLIQAGLKIYTLSLGSMVTVNVLSQLNVYGNQLQFDGHVFSLTNDQQFVSYQFDSTVKSEFPIKIAQEVIAEENLSAYAAAFQLLLYQKLEPVVANVSSVNALFSSYLENEKIKKKAYLFLFSLFGILLVNFLLFTHYNKENALLILEVGAQTANVDQTDLLKKNIAENEMLLKKLNWNGGYNYGFLLNEIGSSMPKRLRLQEVAMNEFKTETEKLERKPTIKILGSTDNLTAVNNWIFVLKEKPWVKAIRLLKYQEDLENSKYQFNIIINY